jgi:hypothetical protein
MLSDISSLADLQRIQTEEHEKWLAEQKEEARKLEEFQKQFTPAQVQQKISQIHQTMLKEDDMFESHVEPVNRALQCTLGKVLQNLKKASCIYNDELHLLEFNGDVSFSRPMMTDINKLFHMTSFEVCQERNMSYIHYMYVGVTYRRMTREQIKPAAAADLNQQHPSNLFSTNPTPRPPLSKKRRYNYMPLLTNVRKRIKTATATTNTTVLSSSGETQPSAGDGKTTSAEATEQQPPPTTPLPLPKKHTMYSIYNHDLSQYPVLKEKIEFKDHLLCALPVFTYSTYCARTFRPVGCASFDDETPRYLLGSTPKFLPGFRRLAYNIPIFSRGFVCFFFISDRPLSHFLFPHSSILAKNMLQMEMRCCGERNGHRATSNLFVKYYHYALGQ